MTAAGPTTFWPAGSPGSAGAQSRGTTMVIAAPATPQSLDHEYDVSLGTIDAVGALYDNLLEYEKIPDPLVPAARREDTRVHTHKPYNPALRGKPAPAGENFFLAPAGPVRPPPQAASTSGDQTPGADP